MKLLHHVISIMLEQVFVASNLLCHKMPSSPAMEITGGLWSCMLGLESVCQLGAGFVLG